MIKPRPTTEKLTEEQHRQRHIDSALEGLRDRVESFGQVPVVEVDRGLH